MAATAAQMPDHAITRSIFRWAAASAIWSATPTGRSSGSLEKRISPHGVTRGQWYFLRVLWEEDGLSQRELSVRVGMMEPTTVIALRSMEKAGLVRRARSVVRPPGDAGASHRQGEAAARAAACRSRKA